MEAQKFGARLRQLRKQADLTQRELADRVNIDFTYLSKIESGAMPPPSERVILQLAEALNADKDELAILAGRIPSDIVQILRNGKTLQRLRSDRAKQMSRSSKKRGETIHIIKQLMSYKRLSKIAIPIVLVLAVAASLWFASPAPVKAFDITFPTLPSSGTLGATYSFTVKIEISDTELLPIQSANLTIYNLTDPATYKATCTDLPLSTDSKSYTGDVTGGGAVTIVATAEATWAYTYGYGYVAWEGTAFPFGYGYGYGYSPGTGTTSITYDVTWTSPPGWPEGGYKAEVKVTANTTTFTETSSQFTLSAPVVYVAPPVVVPPGVTDVSDVVTAEGVFTEDATAESEDALARLTIDEGTTGLIEGEPLSEISMLEMEVPPAPPADSSVIGLVYDFGPDGATFEPPITLTFTYDPALIPEGVLEENLVIAIWDAEAGEWVNLVSIVDPVTNTIRAPVSHFTAFTVLAYTRPAAFVATDLVITPDEVDIGERVTISALVTNTGDLTGTYEVILKIDNVVVATKEVTVAGGARQKITFTTSKDVAATYTVNVNGLSGTFTVKAAPAPATFAASALTISPTEVDIGEKVIISVLVANTGDLSGSYTVTLTINKVVVATKDVTLAGGASQKVTFTTVKDVAGSYAVDVDGLVGTFVVRAVPPPPINWWLIGGIIAAVIVIGVVIWQLVIRRRA